MESWVQNWQPRTNAICVFSFPCLQSTAPALRQSGAGSYRVLHLSCKLVLANLKIWCSNMQPFKRNQRPDLLTSDGDVSCTALATRNSSLQILFKRPTPAIVFATEPTVCFLHVDFEMCFAPQCATTACTFSHVNFQKRTETVSF